MAWTWTSLTRRNFVTGVGALAAGLAARPRSAGSQATGTLRVRLDQDLKTLAPGHASFSDLTIGYAIFSRLIRPVAGDSWEWELDAAQSFEVVDPTHFKFTLRPGIQFTNGFGEMTADDVKFSYERMADPATAAAYDDWHMLDRVDVTDRYSGVIVTKEPNVMVMSVSLPHYRSSIMSRKAMESVGGLFTTDPPAVSGRYTIKEWVPKQKLTLVRNELWNGPQPEFEEIEAIPIDDENTAALAFEAGEIDFTEIGMALVEKYLADPPPGGKLLLRPLIGIEWLGMNTDHAQFQDQRVRRAVQLAVDVDSILEAAYFGQSKRATGIVAPGLVGHRDSLLYPNRDVEQAKRLLAEAGYADGFETTLSIINTTGLMTMAQIVQANLAEVGIGVEINGLESGVFWTLGMEEEGDAWKDLQLVIQQWPFGIPDALEATRWFVPEQIGIWNWERWNNEEYGRLHNEALADFDDARRHQRFVRMQDLMEESGAYVWFSNGIKALLYRDTIVPAVSPDGSIVLLDQFRRA